MASVCRPPAERCPTEGIGIGHADDSSTQDETGTLPPDSFSIAFATFMLGVRMPDANWVKYGPLMPIRLAKSVRDLDCRNLDKRDMRHNLANS